MPEEPPVSTIPWKTVGIWNSIPENYVEEDLIKNTSVSSDSLIIDNDKILESQSQ